MEDYRLEQSGQEVQGILNGAAMQSDLTAETERAELAEQTLQGGIDAEELARQQADQALQGNIDAEEIRAKAAEKQNADDIDVIEGKIPSDASSENKLATKDYVDDSVATSTATFRGTYNLVSDLHLTPDATQVQIAAALAGVIATADNNDYAFVQIPTSVDTPTQIAEIERYKFDGSAWAFEYELNNSGFTAAQWAAINSGITSGLVTKLSELPTNAQLTTLLGGKQDTLTFDSAPTPGSENPVRSGGVYTAVNDEKTARQNVDQSLQNAIEAILLLIPSAATALNQLADKNFVNSSIATSTATFRGTYNLVSDLHLSISATHSDIAAALANIVSGEDENDYAFVQIPTSADTPTEIRVTERYKYNGSAWAYEYDLNNSGYTAAQWAAINSGITQVLVGKLSNLPTADELTTLLNGKQNVLTFDNVPTPGSNNPVKSGGLYELFAAIDAKLPSDASASNKLVAENRLAAYVGGIIGALDATFDLTSTDGHVTLKITQTDGLIASVQVLTSDIASAAQVSQNTSDIATLQDLYNALQQSAPEIIQPTDTWPVAVADRSATVIYRVIDRVNMPPEYYSDYMFKASDLSGQPVLMATYNNAIDPRPKKGSANLVTSGGVFDNMGALDVSELNATGGTLTPYATLDAALAAIPSDYQKGGMSIKYVQTSDNKYVQARLMADSFTTDITQWQGVDDEVTPRSKNLIESGSVYKAIKDTLPKGTEEDGFYICNENGEVLIRLDELDTKSNIGNYLLSTLITRLKIGDINSLTTEQKDTLVNAINSIQSNIHDVAEDGFYICNEDGEVIAYFVDDKWTFITGGNSSKTGVYTKRGNIASGDTWNIVQNCVKHGQRLMFSGMITTFDTISIGHGTISDHEGSWVEVDDTNLYVHFVNSPGSEQSGYPKTYAHGLTIENNIQIEVVQKNAVTAKVRITSNGYVYETPADVTWFGSSGNIYMTSTAALTNCSFGWTSSQIDTGLWLFGDSYFSLVDNKRWTYYLFQNGYTNFMLDGRPGEGSASALEDLQQLLTISTPKIIVWCMGMNDPDSQSAVNATWKSTLDSVIEICQQKNIELILSTIPTVVGGYNPDTQSYNLGIHKFKDAIVRESGYRYIDFASAVGANENTGEWFNNGEPDDMLEGYGEQSGRVHPTVYGAKALYAQAIADCPELVK